LRRHCYRREFWEHVSWLRSGKGASGSLDFNIHGYQGEWLKVTVIGYSFPEADDDWDRNWLDCLLHLELEGFKADFAFGLRTDELENFLQEAEQLYANMKGKAVLKNMDSVIRLEVTADKTGRLIWDGELVYPAGVGTFLKFTYESDQTFLPGLISEIRQILRQYPVRHDA